METEASWKARVVVIGAGISGLAVAFEILERSERLPFPVDLTLLESGDRVGGNIRSGREEGFLCEWGPTGFLDNAPATLTLARRLRLEERLERAAPAADDRYVYRRGQLRRLETHPLRFMTSRVLSLRGRLRLLLEPLARRRKEGSDESVLGFASRRIGKEAASVLVDAMVSGVFAGSAAELSLEAAFPKMHQMESEHGSLFRAMLARRRAAQSDGTTGGGPAGPGGRLTSFRDGMQELPDALARHLGSRVRLSHPVEAVSHLGRRGVRVHPAEGAPLDVDAVVLAVPAWRAAPILGQLDETIHQALAEIPGAPVAVVHQGFTADALGNQPRGFGFLVPRGEGLRILGSLWTSEFFSGRAPEHRRLITTMIGGSTDPEAIDLDDEELRSIVRGDLKQTMGVQIRPYFSCIYRHPRGIPQYTVGHPGRVARIEERLADYPGLWLSGNSYRGVSVNACIEEAPGVAEQLVEFLAAKAAAAP